MIRCKKLLVCVISITAILVGSANAALVANYDCDDDFSASISVENSAAGSTWGNAVAHGVSSDLITSGYTGYIGDAIEITSAAFIDTQNKLSTTGDWTLAGWVNIADTDKRSVLFGQYTSGASGSMYFMASDQSYGSKARLYINGGVSLAGTTKIDDGQWHFIAATRNGDVFTLYVDGVAEGSQTVASISVNQLTDLAVGNLATDGTNLTTDITVDEVSVYDNALNATEIATLYQSIPEPATILILGLGGLATLRKNKK